MHFFLALILRGFRSGLEIIIWRWISPFVLKDIQSRSLIEAMAFGDYLLLHIIQVINIFFLSWRNNSEIRTRNSKWYLVPFYSFSLKPRGRMAAGINLSSLGVLHKML
jgi:hypothetical protein